MKKFLVALAALGVISVTHAAKQEIYQITTFTKAQKKQVEAELAEGSGDSIVIPTNKGPHWIYIDSQAAQVLMNSKAGECYKITSEYGLDMKAQKVKCPTTTTQKNTKKKMTQAQIDVCVNKWVNAYRAEAGEDAVVRYDMLNEWEDWCKQGKTP